MKKKNRENLIKEIIELLASSLNVKSAQISANTSLRDDLGVDSFKVVELIYELELHYNLKIPNKDINKLNTIDNIASYIFENNKK